MNLRRISRRAAIQTIGLGIAGSVVSSPGTASSTHVIPDKKRDDDRIQFVEANPEAGFNYPYLLGTPETFRSAPVPLLVTMNSAREGMPLTADGSDDQPTVAQRARTQIQKFEQIGPWVSERLGIPQLVPVFPLPDGDPVDNTHKTLLLDRETMLIEGTDLERIDRQLLRMTEHARQEMLGDHQMHDQLLFWGNSSGGVTAEHMAVLHPEEILAFAGAGINGIATLPLAELGDHTLKYPVGIADLESITSSPFNAEAFDDVNKFYIQGGRDTHNRLKFHEERPEPVDSTPVWNDPEVYATAKAVYGRDMVADRLPRCHIAFEKAGISGQFRVYPEMTHFPLDPAAHDILEFLRRSIEGKDVSDFSQELTLPFDRAVTLQSSNPRTGDPLRFDISGDYPPPEGLVTYTWQVSDGRKRPGPETTFAFEESGRYDLALEMETAHGQFAQRGMSLLGDGTSFAAFQYAVDVPRPRYQATSTDFLVDESITVDVSVTNVGAAPGERELEFIVDGETTASRTVQLEESESTTVSFDFTFKEQGDVEIHIPPAYRERFTVNPREPKFALVDAGMSKSEVTPGDAVTIQASVKNSGTGPGEIPLKFKANGEVIAEKRITLDVNATESVSFQHVFEEPGDYELKLNGELIGTVSVIESTPTTSPVSTASETPTTETPGQPGLGAISAIAGIGSAVSYLLYRDDSGEG